MSPRASQGVATAFSRSVADSINHLIGMSGMPVTQMLLDANMSRNYYYKRARYELPFNTNDISSIAQALGLSPDVIVSDALALMNRSKATTEPVSNVTVGRFGQDDNPAAEKRVAHEEIDETGEDLE